MQMNDKETKAFEFLMFAENEKFLIKEAATLIAYFWRYIKRKRRFERKLRIIGSISIEHLQ